MAFAIEIEEGGKKNLEKSKFAIARTDIDKRKKLCAVQINEKFYLTRWANLGIFPSPPATLAFSFPLDGLLSRLEKVDISLVLSSGKRREIVIPRLTSDRTVIEDVR